MLFKGGAEILLGGAYRRRFIFVTLNPEQPCSILLIDALSWLILASQSGKMMGRGDDWARRIKLRLMKDDETSESPRKRGNPSLHNNV